MSNVKERILGAVTIMSEEDAIKVWNLIQGAFALSNAEEVAPYPDELAAISAYKAGDPDYQPSKKKNRLLRQQEPACTSEDVSNFSAKILYHLRDSRTRRNICVPVIFVPIFT